MKPLFSRADSLMTTMRFIGALGISLIALSAHAETTFLADEAGVVGRSDLAQAEKDIVVGLPAQSVTRIEVHPEGDQVTVIVVGDGKLFPDARLLDESRLVIDIPAVSSTLRHSVVQGHHHLLKKVRVGNHADKVRLVLDVLERPAFSLNQKDNKILVTLKPNEHKGSPANVAQYGGSESSPLLASLEPKAFIEPMRRVAQRVTRIIGPGQPKFRVQPVQMATEGASAKMDSRSDDLVTGQTRFVGRRISLDFQQADITNILRLIAEVSGFNIVVGEGVNSKVTMKLVSAPWDQTLDMLLRMNGLGMIRQGSIVWVDTLANIAKQQDEEARARDSKLKAEKMVERVFYIRHLNAQELLTGLRQFISSRGKMNISKGTNALIVRDTETKVENLKRIIEGLDLETPQVQIEARIVQADTVYARGLGDLPPINQAGCSVRIPVDGRRGHGTQTVSGRGDHRASADARK